MQLFYNALLTPESKEYVLPKDESKHIIKVLRKEIGDTIFLTNGKGYLFNAEVANTNHNKCLLSIISHDYQEEPANRLHLAVSPTKLNDRYEWFLEKATEIGISEITPIICENSERRVIKTERFEKIIQSAMKQSLHYHLPKLNKLISFEDFLVTQKVSDNNSFIAHCEDEDKVTLKSAIRANEDCLVLIGPEGDFTPTEIHKALKSGIKPVSLGKSRLRTETAAIVVCHTFNFVNE